MTVRDYLDWTARGFARVIAIGFGACVLTAVGWLALGLPDWVMGVATAGFLVAWVTIAVLAVAGIRCPACGRRLEQFYRERLLWSADLRYCPGCGLDLRRPLRDVVAGEPAVAPDPRRQTDGGDS